MQFRQNSICNYQVDVRNLVNTFGEKTVCHLFCINELRPPFSRFFARSKNSDFLCVISDFCGMENSNRNIVAHAQLTCANTNNSIASSIFSFPRNKCFFFFLLETLLEVSFLTLFGCRYFGFTFCLQPYFF